MSFKSRFCPDGVEFHCIQNTASDPTNELMIGSYCFDLDEFLLRLAELSLKKERSSRSLTNYVYPAEVKKWGIRTALHSQAIDFNPGDDFVCLWVGGPGYVVTKEELPAFLRWLLAQVTWIQESPRPLTSWNSEVQKRIEEFIEWARR